MTEGSPFYRADITQELGNAGVTADSGAAVGAVAALEQQKEKKKAEKQLAGANKRVKGKDVAPEKPDEGEPLPKRQKKQKGRCVSDESCPCCTWRRRRRDSRW